MNKSFRIKIIQKGSGNSSFKDYVDLMNKIFKENGQLFVENSKYIAPLKDDEIAKANLGIINIA